MGNTKAIEGWVGANNEQAAKLMIETKHPEISGGAGRIVNLRQTISGMWSYRIELPEAEENSQTQAQDDVNAAEEGSV